VSTLDQQIHLFFNSQFNKTKQQAQEQIKRMHHSFPPKNNSVRIHLLAGKEFAIGKRMRESKPDQNHFENGCGTDPGAVRGQPRSSGRIEN
jgi:hypothetical protein